MHDFSDVNTVLVLGATGLAGQAFSKEFVRRKKSVIGVARKNTDIQLDLTDSSAVENILNDLSPDLVINCAAQTNLQKCEIDRESAWLINSELCFLISNWSLLHEKPIIHISTDHFFGDTARRAHKEDAAVYLGNYYAQTKYAAECFVKRSPHSLILRTSILGKRGWVDQTFSEWAYDNILNKKQMNLFEDAFTSSMEVNQLAECVAELFLTKKYTGLINLGCKEVFSKAEFIVEMANQLKTELNAPNFCSIKKYNSLSCTSLGLDVTLAQSIMGIEMPSLKETVKRTLCSLNSSSSSLQGG